MERLCLCLIYSLVSLINKPKLAERQKLELDLLNLQGSDGVDYEVGDFFNCVEGPLATPLPRQSQSLALSFSLSLLLLLPFALFAPFAACA